MPVNFVGWAAIDGQVAGFGESGKESRVVVSVLAEYVDEHRELFQKWILYRKRTVVVQSADKP